MIINGVKCEMGAITRCAFNQLRELVRTLEPEDHILIKIGDEMSDHDAHVVIGAIDALYTEPIRNVALDEAYKKAMIQLANSNE